VSRWLRDKGQNCPSRTQFKHWAGQELAAEWAVGRNPPPGPAAMQRGRRAWCGAQTPHLTRPVLQPAACLCKPPPCPGGARSLLEDPGEVLGVGGACV